MRHLAICGRADECGQTSLPSEVDTQGRAANRPRVKIDADAQVVCEQKLCDPVSSPDAPPTRASGRKALSYDVIIVKISLGTIGQSKSRVAGSVI